ncbi:MAG: hypothetical protein AAB467_04835 [Patescibacteria group bacterium]
MTNLNPPTGGATTWFLLGRDPILSASEIISLLKREGVVYKNPILKSPFLFLDADLQPNTINRLGGTIKIAEELGTDLSEDTLLGAIKTKLSNETKKIIFGISFYGEDHTEEVEHWGKELKKILKADGHAVRYVFNRESILSSVTVEKNSLTDKGYEFLILKNSKGYQLARTTAVQPFENFSARDYGRPSRDSESGMLPPKLAMMMINLSETPTDQTLLDPFCGSGTIISEALLLGYSKVRGTDSAEKAIADSNENISWLIKNKLISESKDWKIELTPAQKLSKKFDDSSIGGIVAEPYLGKPKNGRETAAELAKEAGELAALYVEAFGQFKKILRPGGRVVFIIPRFVQRNGAPITISEKILPKLLQLGFAVDPAAPEFSKSPFILYQRPSQFVAREIWRFKTSS